MTSSLWVDDESPGGMTLNLFGKVIVVMVIGPVLLDEVVLLEIVRSISFS